MSFFSISVWYCITGMILILLHWTLYSPSTWHFILYSFIHCIHSFIHPPILYQTFLIPPHPPSSPPPSNFSFSTLFPGCKTFVCHAHFSSYTPCPAPPGLNFDVAAQGYSDGAVSPPGNTDAHPEFKFPPKDSIGSISGSSIAADDEIKLKHSMSVSAKKVRTINPLNTI